MLEKPGIVDDARSAPVGKPPLVALTESVRFGVVPVQEEQIKLMSTLLRAPLIPGVKVCPPQVVMLRVPVPLPVLVFCRSRVMGLSRTISSTLVLSSTFVGTPV